MKTFTFTFCLATFSLIWLQGQTLPIAEGEADKGKLIVREVNSNKSSAIMDNNHNDKLNQTDLTPAASDCNCSSNSEKKSASKDKGKEEAEESRGIFSAIRTIYNAIYEAILFIYQAAEATWANIGK